MAQLIAEHWIAFAFGMAGGLLVLAGAGLTVYGVLRTHEFVAGNRRVQMREKA